MLMYWKIVIYKRELLDIQVPIFLSKSKEKKMLINLFLYN